MTKYVKTTQQVKSTMSAKEELEALKAKYLKTKEPKVEKSTDQSQPLAVEAVALTLDLVDSTAKEVKETFTGENNIFARINLARMKRKIARGGYDSCSA